jgi:Replication-relaxation
VTGRNAWLRAAEAVAAARLTERDRAICEELYEQRVLTSLQVRELHFQSNYRARKRLLELHRLAVLDRFRPYRRQGSYPYHYLLDELGAAVVASERGLEPRELEWSRARSLKLASSGQLQHLVQANGFFTKLIEALRPRRGLALLDWWGQRRCAQVWGELVRPDGYCALARNGDLLELCLEWDRGSEPLGRLADKLVRYAELEAALGRTLAVAIVASSERREREIHRAVRPESERVLLTTADRHTADPLAANWLMSGARLRTSLLELAERPARPPNP